MIPIGGSELRSLFVIESLDVLGVTADQKKKLFKMAKNEHFALYKYRFARDKSQTEQKKAELREKWKNQSEKAESARRNILTPEQRGKLQLYIDYHPFYIEKQYL